MEVEHLVSCPFCGETNSRPLYEVRDILYGIPGTYTLHICPGCGLIYLNPRPTPQAMAAYYPEEYRSYRLPVADEPFILMRWMRQRKLSRRRQLIEAYSQRATGRILDVGCSTGLFLHEMATHGWTTQGIEPITFAAEFAQEHFGLDIFQGTLQEFPQPETLFDAITFWDVLEHTYDPMAELQKAASLMKTEGLLAINIPNWESIDRHLFGEYWQGFDPPRHLYMFTRAALTQMLAQAGFEILRWVCFMPGYFSFAMSIERWLKAKLPSWAKIVSAIMSIPGSRLPFEPWFSLLNKMGKGPLVAVLARKRA